MEWDGCSEPALSNAPLQHFEPADCLPVTFEEPAPEESAIEPDPDVVLENLFRNSVGTRRKSVESRRKSARNCQKTVVLPPILPKISNRNFHDNKLSEDYVQEISSDSDGSTPILTAPALNGITVPSEVPVPTPKHSTNFEFVTVDLSRNHAVLDEPFEEDPLAGDEKVPKEGTILDPIGITPLVPVRDAPVPRETLLGDPISKGENPVKNEPSASIDATVPGGLIMIKNVNDSETGSSETTNITISSALETFSTREDDFFEVEIKKELPDRPEIDAVQSPASSTKIPPLNFGSGIPRPISLPGGTLVPVLFSELAKKPSNDSDRSMSQSDKPKPKTASSATNFAPILPRPGSIPLPGGTLVPIPFSAISGNSSNNQKDESGTQFPFELPHIQPGSNVVVVMMPDGQLATVPVQSLNPSLINDRKTASVSSSTVRSKQNGSLQNPPVTAPIPQPKKRGRPRKVPGTPSKSKASPKFLTTAPLSGSWTNPKPPKRLRRKQNPPDQSIISDPLELEEDPLKGPEQDLNSIWQDVFSKDSTSLKPQQNHCTVDNGSPVEGAVSTQDIQKDPNGCDKMIDMDQTDIENFLDKPSLNSSKPTKRVQPLWPPPNMLIKRKKKRPKIPPVAELPLSGSWTNPNPKPAIEKDPLEGPIESIIPWTDDNLNGHREPFQLPSLCIKDTKSTQHNAFNSLMDDVTLSEAAGLETKDLSRPLVTFRGYGLDVPAKQIVYNLYKYFEYRRITYNLRYLSIDLTSIATGVKSCTIRSILREAKKTCRKDDFTKIPKFAPVVRRRNRVKYIHSNLRIDIALRERMLEHFLKKNEALALAPLKKKCHLVFGAKASRFYGLNFVRHRMKTMGFVCVRTVRRKIHVEGTAVRAWRHKYLTQLNKCIEEKKNIVFTLVVDLLEVPRSAGEEWVPLESDDEIKPGSRVLTIFHAANENGFLDEGFSVKEASRNSQNATESSYFEWLELNVLQKIPKGSVVVLAHQRFHSMKDIEMKPNESSSKKEIIDWLRSKVVCDVDETLPKCILLDKASTVPVERGYSIDSLVETYGHTPVHLFQHQRDLNPLEYVWEDIRTKIYQQGRLVFKKDALGSAFDSKAPIFQFGWHRYNVWRNYYVEKDPLLEVAQETAVSNLGGIWTPPSADGPYDLVNDQNVQDELERDSSSEKSLAKSKESESDPDSNSDAKSDADSDSSSSPSDSDCDSDSSDSDSDDSSSSESEDELPLSERMNCDKELIKKENSPS